MERCVAEHGRLDVLVNAAANGFAPRDVEELTEDDWDSAFGAVAKGSFFVTQAAAPHLRRSDVGARGDDRGRGVVSALGVVRRALRRQGGPGDAHKGAREGAGT